jgi:benzylsuccinate CoA-transferase BbsF subunit
MAGLYATFAVLAALQYRDRTAEGQYVDISEYESICTLLGPAFLGIARRQKEVFPNGNCSEYVLAAPYGCYKCKGDDRWCVIAVHNEEEWQSLCKVMRSPDWTKEERFSTLLKRKQRSEELNRFLEEWTVQYPVDEVVLLLQKNGIPAGVVQNAEDLAKDPQLIARRFFVPLKHPTLGETVSDGSPIRLEENFTTDWKAAPLLGEDNRYVYMGLLGFTESELSSYMERGFIG